MHGVGCYSGLMIEPGACGTAAYDQTGVVQGHEGEVYDWEAMVVKGDDTACEGVWALNSSLRATGGTVMSGKVSQVSHSVSLPVKESKP